jgi:hypothetical protein
MKFLQMQTKGAKVLAGARQAASSLSLFASVGMLLCALWLPARGAGLRWPANAPEDGVTRYVIFAGIVSGLYDFSIETTNTEINIDALVADGLQHFFVCRAENSEGLSDPTNEAAWMPARDLTVTVVVESAGEVPGVWEFEREYSFISPATTNQRFFRARLKIE